MKEDQPETCEHLLVLQEGSPPKKSVFFACKSRVMDFGCPNLDVCTSDNCAEVEMRLVRVVFLVGVPCQPHVEDDQGHND